MKIAKRLLPLLLVLLTAAGIGIGCSNVDKTGVEEVIISELDLLKDLDAKTTQKYISYKELFPDATEDNDSSDKVKEVFSLFFQNFNYKILTIDVDNENESATASVRLTTLDSQALARDFAEERLRQEILQAAHNGTQDTETTMFSMEDRYLILNSLLKQNSYDAVETNCTIHLLNTDTQNENWEIQRTYALENSLVGGLMTYLSDPDVLPPEDTLAVYLKTLKKMNVDEMSSYLGAETILNTSDAEKKAIASALVEQVHKCFNYAVKDCSVNGYTATIQTEITSFDSDKILSSYQKELNTYLESPDAVIDGSENRYKKSYALLLESIEENDAVTTSSAEFTLINDGASWKLDNENSELGKAIFGSLTAISVSDAADMGEEDLSDQE